ncbi:MAG: histone deacetylase family protein [Solirubrobacteraceae bacterium]
MASVLLKHPSSVEHDTGSHPEQAARIAAIEQELSARDWLGYERVESSEVDVADLTAVHPREYVDAIERISASGGGYLDPDTVASEGSYRAALHAAGGAVGLVDMLLDGQASTAFSIHRPPGHHALPGRAMGFCLFNNIAIAARHAVRARRLGRVLIFDWDVHHGNGTNDIFHATDQVLFISIHESPLYPGTGPATDVGSGAGRGYTVNLPVSAGAHNALYRSLVDHVVVPLAQMFEPQLVLISAGFDAHREDPLATCALTEEGFAEMARSLRRCCAGLEVPLGAVLEGGYALGALARSVAATLEVLAEPVSGAESGSDVGVAPAARAARERLAEWWPGLV